MKIPDTVTATHTLGYPVNMLREHEGGIITANFAIEIRGKRFMFWPSWFPFGKTTRVIETTEKQTWADIYHIISEIRSMGFEVTQVCASENIWGN